MGSDTHPQSSGFHPRNRPGRAGVARSMVSRPKQTAPKPPAADPPARGRRSYADKRDFTRTPEPSGAGKTRNGRDNRPIFVVQKHDASRLHWDFRLEHGGVLWSWAVPKGPSMDPADKRLAVHVEDHPRDYAGFSGTIPEGNYGAGTVEIWDQGHWAPLGAGDPAEALAAGELKFTLDGGRLQGGFVLVRLKPRGGRKSSGDDWLLIKERDDTATAGRDATALEQSQPASGTSDEAPAKKPASKRATRTAKDRISPPADQQPQLARLVTRAPTGKGWISEVKYDGYRILARREGTDVRLITRNGLDWTKRLAPIAAAVAELPADTLLLDGELVAFERDGRTSFSRLQAALGDSRPDRLRYVAFDLLFRDGSDLRKEPLSARKEALEAVLADHGDGLVSFGEHLTSDAAQVRDKACAFGLEGIICKRLDAPYVAGRGGDWVKVKCHDREEFAVLGWTDPKRGRSGFGALQLGYRDPDGSWHSAGGCGTGFSDKLLGALRARLDTIAAPPPEGLLVSEAPPRDLHWVRPDIVVEIRHAGWTGGGMLRQAAFLGVREDKPAEDVVRPVPESETEPTPFGGASGGKARVVRAAKPKTHPKAADEPTSDQNAPEQATRPTRIVHARKPQPRGGGATVLGQALTHPERELWPGITKADLARYWERIAGVALPDIAARPLAFLRCPDGIQSEHFFQKHAGRGQPASITEGAFDNAPYLTIADGTGLAACAQIAAIELHCWGSTLDDPGHPDRLVFDLDPGDGVTMAEIADAAKLLRERLDKVGLAAFCRTSGGKGLHVVAPLTPRADWETARAWSRAFAENLAAELPARFVAATRKDIRGGHILIDWLRNGLGSTAVASFSPRARPGATVATPLDWREVTAKLDPRAFTIETIPARVTGAKARDRWPGFTEAARPLPALPDRKGRRR